jgi:formylglycine-generating enzyme required for sulfatase activity
MLDDNGNYKFNFNNGQNSNSNVYISSVYKYPKNKFGLYDCTGNTSVWFRTNETEYIYDIDGNNNNIKDWRYGAFKRLLDEGAQPYNVDYNNIDITKRIKMVSRGTCNSTLSDVQNGKYDVCHIFEANPFLGFITAAKVITVSKKKNII